MNTKLAVIIFLFFWFALGLGSQAFAAAPVDGQVLVYDSAVPGKVISENRPILDSDGKILRSQLPADALSLRAVAAVPAPGSCTQIEVLLNTATGILYGCAGAGANPVVAVTTDTDTYSHSYTFGCNQNVATTTDYLNVGDLTTSCTAAEQIGSPNSVVLITKPQTFRNLYCERLNAPSSSTERLTVRVAGASTSITCDFANAAKTCNDTTNTATGTAGQKLAIERKDQVGTPADSQLICSVQGDFQAALVPVAPVTDVTAPSVTACTAVAVASTTASIRCTVTDAVSTIFTTKVRYGTADGGPYGSTSAEVNCVTPCTVNLTGLTSATTYYGLFDATDAAVNTGTSAQVSLTTTAATDFYIATTGADTNAGTSAAPWKTFAVALQRLTAGKRLLVKNGTYDNANGAGFPNINCSAGYVTGTAGNVITVEAENERQAFISNNGSAAANTFVIQNCNYWRVKGLRIENADSDNGTISDGHVMVLKNSNNLTIDRNLIQKNNRYRNSHLISAETVKDSLFEENEFYSFHRYALRLGGTYSAVSSGNTVRRNYCHSRAYADLAGATTTAPPYKSVQSPGGDACVAMYPGKTNKVENNITEDSYIGVYVLASGPSTNNALYGNISLNEGFGLLFTPKAGDPDSALTEGNTAINQVAVKVGSSNYNGPRIESSNAKGSRCDNCTVKGSTVGAFRAAQDTSSGFPLCGASCTFYADDSLAFSNTGTGFFVDSTLMSAWTLNFTASFGNGTNWSPAATDPNITNEFTADPLMGSCLVRIPTTATPLKGTGLAGADIGANVLYKYVAGVLGTDPLWNAADSYKPYNCGTVVTGVNSDTSTSCTGVQTRLNVGVANGCALPY